MNEDHTRALTLRASLLIDQQRYDDAASLLADALSVNPEDAGALYLLALCQLNIPGKTQDAVETINRALALDSMNASFFALRSLAYRELGRNKPAVADAQQAVAIDPENVFAHISLGSALLGLEKWQDAENAFRAALALDPENSDAGNLLALALRHQNRHGETEEHIGRLLAKNPNDGLSHANAGWVALEQHDLEKAKFHFLESLRIDPLQETARRGIVETFKAKSPPYRLYLDYCIKMARLPRNMRLGIIVGLYFGVRLLRNVFTGDLAIIGTIIAVLYMILALWSWVARGVGNLFLLFDNFARHALTKNETAEAVFVGGNVLAGIVISVAAFAGRIAPLHYLGFSLIGSAFPFSMVFENRHSFGKKFYAGIGAFIMLGGISSWLLYHVPFQGVNAATLGSGAVGIAVLVTWLGAFGFLRK